MKILLIIFLPLVFLAENEECQNRFRTGRYYYGDTILFDGVEQVFNAREFGYFVRKEKTQTEIDPIKKTMNNFRIEWLSGCRYNLIFLSSNNPKSVFVKGDTVKVQILEMSKSWYRYRSNAKYGEIEGKIYKASQ